MKNIFLILAIIAALSVSSMGAEYKLEVDCNHSSINNTDTGNRITVSLLGANGKRIQTKYRDGVRKCSINNATFSFSTNLPVTSIEFSTNGNDAFYVDEFRLYRNGTLIKHEGRDNGRGWCLSTDPKDSAGPWKNYVSGGCQPRIRFRVSNTPARTPVPVRAVPNPSTTRARNYEQECFNLVQGRVAYDRQGNTRWDPRNIRRLCAGTRNPSARIACFRSWINTNSGWTAAINNCRANSASRPRSSTPVPSSPRPSPQTIYGFWVDCKNELITNTGTADKITIILYDSNRREIDRETMRNGVGGCASYPDPWRLGAIFDRLSSPTVSHFEVSTTGADAFFIDRVKITKDGTTLIDYGTDNGRGWCVSTDPRDSSGPWQRLLVTGCRQTLVFSVPTRTVARVKPPVTNPGNETRNIAWNSSVQNLGYRGRNGVVFRVICPANVRSGKIWGTGVYTDDSSICTAAAHSGMINFASGGLLAIHISRGRNSYGGSTRYGVRSENYGPFQGSFSFIADTRRPQPTGQSQPQPAPREKDEFAPPNPAPAPVRRTNLGPISWEQSIPLRFRGQEVRVTVQCAPNGRPGRIWGTYVYTDNSSICTAAVHAGVFSRAQGGQVTFIARPGNRSHTGSTRNGITSGGHGVFAGSFEILGK